MTAVMKKIQTTLQRANQLLPRSPTCPDEPIDNIIDWLVLYSLYTRQCNINFILTVAEFG